MGTRALTIHCEGPVPALLSHTTDRHLPDAGHVRIVVATLDELADRTERYHAMLDDGELERLARFKFDADRQRFLLGHGLLREVIGQVLNMDPRSIGFQRGRYGKPFLPGTPLRFNLSDTKDAVAIAITVEEELGVDIETMTRRVDHRSVSQHYFTEEEQAGIAAAADDKRRFLELWTRKEAVLKASGVGIMDDLRSLRVDQPTNELAIRHLEFIAMSGPIYHVRTWHIGEDLLLSLATARPMDHVDLLRA